MNITKFWSKLQTLLDVKSGAILGVYSMMMISLSCYAVLTKKEIPTAVASSYGIVITAFAAFKISKEK